MKRLLYTAVLLMAAAAGAFAPLHASAQVGVSVVVGSPPPPVRYEAAPPGRPGYVWAPGYWNWDGRRYIWIGGHWEARHAGRVYYAPVWRQGPRGWVLDRGGWRGGRPGHGDHRHHGGDRHHDGHR